MFFEFNANTRIVQEITELAPGYTFERIIEGLQSGDMATSLVSGEIINLINGELAGRVKTVESDGEYEDFGPVSDELEEKQGFFV